MAVTTTPAAGPSRAFDTSASARRGPRRQARAASCSSRSTAGVPTAWGTRARATTAPPASTATALTDVVPMSTPTVHAAPVVPLHRHPLSPTTSP